MEDIYGNLDNYEDENRLESLQNENLELKTKVISITNDITHLQAEYDFLKSEFDKMKANYSSLLKTAKAEIQRKTKIISALNAEKDQLIIGIINDSTHKSINSIRYNAKVRTAMVNSNKSLKEQPECKTDTAQELGDGQDNTPNSRKSTSQDQIAEPAKDTKRNSTNNTYNKKDCKENVQVSQHNETPTDQKSNKEVQQEQVKQPQPVTKRRKTLPALSKRSISPQYGLNDEESISTKSTLKHNSTEVPSREERLKHTRLYNRKHERNYDFERRKEQYESRYNRGRSPYDDRDSRRYGRNKIQERDFRNKYSDRPEYDRRRVLESPPLDLQRPRNRYRPHEHHFTQEKPRYSEPEHRPPNQRYDASYDGPTKHRQIKMINRQADYMEEDNISAKFSDEEESSISTFTDDRRMKPEPDPRLLSNRYVEVYDNKNNVSTISTVKGRNVDLKLLKYDQNIYVERSSEVSNDNCNSMRTEIRELSVESGELLGEPHPGKSRKFDISPLNAKTWRQCKADNLHKPDDRSSAHGNYMNKMVMIPQSEQYCDRISSQKLLPEDISSTSVKNKLLNDLSLCPVSLSESKEQNVTSTSEVPKGTKLGSSLLNKKLVPKFPYATKDIKRCHSVADDLELSDENSDCNDTMSPLIRDSNIRQETSLVKLQNKNVDESSLITLEDLDLPVKSQSKKFLDIEVSPSPIICADNSKSDNSAEINHKGTSVTEVAPKEYIKTETKSSRKRKNKDLICKESKKSRSDISDKKKYHKETNVSKLDKESDKKRHKQTNVSILGQELDKGHREKNRTPADNLKKVVENPKSREDSGVLELVTQPNLKSKKNILQIVEETKKQHRTVSNISILFDKEKTMRKEGTSVSEPRKISHDCSSDLTKNVCNDIEKLTNISTTVKPVATTEPSVCKSIIENIEDVTANKRSIDEKEQSLESNKNIADSNHCHKVSFVLTGEKPVATTESNVYKDIENSVEATANEQLTGKEKSAPQEKSIVECNKNMSDDNNDSTRLGEANKKRHEVTSVLTNEKPVPTTEHSFYKDIIEYSLEAVTKDQREQSLVKFNKNISNNDSTKLTEPKINRHKISSVVTTKIPVAITKPSVCKSIENSGDVSTSSEQVTLDETSDVSDASEINLSKNSLSGTVSTANNSNPPPDMRIVVKRRRPIMRKSINPKQ